MAWALMLAAGPSVADIDMFHEMALFREMITTGGVPLRDPFAYTPTVYPVVHHEWGMGAVFYAIAVAAGLGGGGIMALKYLLLAALLAGSAWCARLRGARGPVAVLGAPLAIFMSAVAFASVRAQLATLVLLVALLLLLEADRRGRRWWVAVWLPLYVIWLNLHGGFLVGVGVLGLYAAERVARQLFARRPVAEVLRGNLHLAAAGLAMVPLAGANPYGWDYVPYLLRAVTLERATITEWLPLWHPVHHPMLLAAFGLSLVPLVHALRHRRLSELGGLPLLLVTAWLGVNHARHLSLYAVVWFCFVPAYLTGTPAARRVARAWQRMPGPIAALAAAMAIALVVQAVELRFWRLTVPNQGRVRPAYPVGAAEYLESAGFEGNLMTPFRVGAYVSWKLYPKVLVSLDSRYEVAYPPGMLEESRRFYDAQPEWRQTLERYPTDAVLVARNEAVYTALKRETRWRPVYEDDVWAIFVRPGLAASFPTVTRLGETIAGTFP